MSSKRHVAGTGVGRTLALTALLLFGGCCFSPSAYLKYQRHRIGGFCESIVKGEPVDEVSRRAMAEGFRVHDAKKLDPSFGSEVLISTDFLLAHLLCTVTYDGQRQVESVRRSELW
jgi:hypothetical protein